MMKEKKRCERCGEPATLYVYSSFFKMDYDPDLDTFDIETEELISTKDGEEHYFCHRCFYDWLDEEELY